jgi:hypothetical protein
MGIWTGFIELNIRPSSWISCTRQESILTNPAPGLFKIFFLLKPVKIIACFVASM